MALKDKVKGCLLFLFVIFINISGVAQFEKDYSPAAFQDTIPQEVADHLKTRLAEKKRSLNESKATHRNFVYSLYEEHNSSLVKYFNDDYFITNSELTSYLQSILRKILQANPQLKDEINIYPHRSSSPNAMTFWDGTIGVTLGLLARMENEDELAYVICHELAHYYSGHVDQRIQELANANYDPEVEKEIRSVKSSQYERYSRLKKIFSDMNLSLKHHSRKEEFAADSVGLTYFIRTTYQPHASVRLMEILDSAHLPTYKKIIDLKKIYSSKKYPFKENWLTYAKSNMKHNTSDETYGDSDTTHTHPDCKRRVVALRRQLKTASLAEWGKLPVNDAAAKFARMSELEMVESECHFKHYGKSLFMTLAALDKWPDNMYVNSMVGRNMALIYQSMKDHQFGKVVQFPDERLADNYNQVLAFLQNLRIMEVASLAYYYMVAKEEAYFQNEEFLYAFWLVSKLPVSDLSAQLVKDDYLQRFPQGKYVQLLSKEK